jgi:hypothetical protein
MKAWIFVAAGLLAATPSIASADSASWYAESVQTGLRAIDATPGEPATNRPLFAPARVRTAPEATAAAPAFWTNFVTAGGNSQYAPTFSGNDDTLTLPIPENDKPSDYYYQYNITWTVVTQTGKCTAAYAITSGSRTIETQKKTGIDLSGAGGYDWAFVEKTLSKFTGAAVLTGTITCGTTSSAATAPMYF